MKKTCFNVIRVLSYFGTVIFGILMMREYDRVYYSNEVGTSFSERFSALCPFVVFTLICILITLLNDMFLKERGNRDRLHFTVIGDTFLLLILFVVFIVLGVKGALKRKINVILLFLKVLNMLMEHTLQQEKQKMMDLDMQS